MASQKTGQIFNVQYLELALMQRAVLYVKKNPNMSVIQLYVCKILAKIIPYRARYSKNKCDTFFWNTR